jgi:hypothetical protein
MKAIAALGAAALLIGSSIGHADTITFDLQDILDPNVPLTSISSVWTFGSDGSFSENLQVFQNGQILDSYSGSGTWGYGPPGSPTYLHAQSSNSMGQSDVILALKNGGSETFLPTPLPTFALGLADVQGSFGASPSVFFLYDGDGRNVSLAPVPIPGSGVLLLTALVGFIAIGIRRRSGRSEDFGLRCASALGSR